MRKVVGVVFATDGIGGTIGGGYTLPAAVALGIGVALLYPEWVGLLMRPYMRFALPDPPENITTLGGLEVWLMGEGYTIEHSDPNTGLVIARKSSWLPLKGWRRTMRLNPEHPEVNLQDES